MAANEPAAAPGKTAGCIAGVAAGWSERDNSSIMAILRSLVGAPD